MTPILGIWASQMSGHLWAPAGAYDALAAVTLSTATSTISFAGIPTGYKHLQIRFTAFPTSVATSYRIRSQFNGDTGNNYSTHLLLGSGSSPASAAAAASTNQITVGSSVLSGGSTLPVAGILDVLDYTSTAKYKTARSLAGGDFNGAGEVAFNSGLWMNASAVTSVSLYFDTTTLAQYSSFALYGIK